MRIEEAARTGISHAHNALVCEHCCRMLVTPKYRWVEYIQEYLHTFGEIVFILGNCLAILYVGGVMLFAAVFSSHRNSHPYEEEYESYQREWEAKREADAKRVLERRHSAEAEETAAYMNYLEERDKRDAEEEAQRTGRLALRTDSVETEDVRERACEQEWRADRTRREAEDREREAERWRERHN